MKKLLVYTQNHEPGGGNRYLTDFLSMLPPGYEVSLYYNEGALFPADLMRISPKIFLSELPVATETKLRQKLACLPFLGPVLLVYKVLARLPPVRNLLLRKRSKRNREIFKQVIKTSEYSFAIAFNGGFPAGFSCFDFLAETIDANIPSSMSVVSMPAPCSYADIYYSGVIGRIDHFLVNCEAIKKALVNNRAIPQEKVCVLYNVVETNRVSENFVRSGHETEVRFGFIGRIERNKGIYTLIKAFGMIAANHPGISLRLFGKITDEKGVNAAISRAGCCDCIILAGTFTQNVYEVLGGMDVLILPSRWEGFPYVIIEAMVAGLPVIATDVGGIREAVVDGKTGILVPPADPEELANAIVELATDPARRSRMGTLGNQRVKDLFAPDIYARALLETLTRIEGRQENIS